MHLIEKKQKILNLISEDQVTCCSFHFEYYICRNLLLQLQLGSESNCLGWGRNSDKTEMNATSEETRATEKKAQSFVRESKEMGVNKKH